MLAPAITLAARIATGEVTAVEVVSAHLDRVSADVNAFGSVDAERAPAQARDPRPGPLSGVPFTVKDTIAAAGRPFVAGVPERVGVVAEADATVVARLRAAGAIPLGKTSCPPWRGGIETENEVLGRTSNPYDLARTTGGSSGGEAAAIASGASAFGIGSDSGGSVRLPAHFCGLAALKPTAGRVPLTGAIDDLGPLGSLADPRTEVGPLARSVADVALLMTELLAKPVAERAVDRRVLPAIQWRRRARGRLLGDREEVRVLRSLPHLTGRGFTRARARENVHLGEDLVVRDGVSVDRQLQLRTRPDQRGISETGHFG